MAPKSAAASTDEFSSASSNQRLRSFDHFMRKACWEKAAVVPNRHPERWRVDAAGNVVCRKLHACHGCLCFEYDHIVPFSKGGETSIENCQILQTRVNRQKSDRSDVDPSELEQSSCGIKLSEHEMDLVEVAVYGDVLRPGLQCRIRSLAERMGLAEEKSRKGSKRYSSQLPHCDFVGHVEQ